ncbi:MAG: hypothetical protein Q9222_005855 [Ikaeria aurantiellina]
MARSDASFDIVIVGAGPAGLFLAVCLARWGYKIKHIDKREVPTPTGRADGIQPRSLQILRNMGLKRSVMARQPAKVYEVSFWDPAPGGGGIRKTGNWSSCPDFIDARYPFTTLLHQGLIERIFIEDMHKNGTDVQRPWTITKFEIDKTTPDYPLEISLKHVRTHETETVRAKYLFSGEGARSFIRDQLGFQLRYRDPVSYVWGVMDGVVRSNFPDLRIKCTIHSDCGSIMIIPRENNLVRLYIQVAVLDDKNLSSYGQFSEEEVQASARKILAPYYIEWDRVEWFSVYPIGQGIVDHYASDNRIFLGGDCCHTHSPKAGQGMNTAFHDALNLAWKIHHVEAGFADLSVLSTYEFERKYIAENLLDFDAKYAALFSQHTPSASEVNSASQDTRNGEENDFVKTFKASQEFTSGYGILYPANEYNWTPCHPATSHLFFRNHNKLRPGYVMPSADVRRVVDANVVQLEQEVPFNGSFRLFIFAGNMSVTAEALADLAANIRRKNSFYAAYERADAPSVSYHEHHNPHSHFFTICTIFAAPRNDIDISIKVPEIFSRYSNHIYADDIRDKRMPDVIAPAHARMGLDAERGGIVIVRPDGHVGCALQLSEGSGTVDALDQYFGAFVTKTLGQDNVHARL